MDEHARQLSNGKFVDDPLRPRPTLLEDRKLMPCRVHCVSSHRQHADLSLLEIHVVEMREYMARCQIYVQIMCTTETARTCLMWHPYRAEVWQGVRHPKYRL